MKKQNKTARFHFRLTDDLADEIHLFARTHGLGRAAAIRELITIALSKPAKSNPAR